MGRRSAKIARERILRLLELARRDPEHCHRYAQLAWKIYTKYRPRIPKQLKSQICRRCHAFLIPGRSLKVRLHDRRIVSRCLRCGWVRRIPY